MQTTRESPQTAPPKETSPRKVGVGSELGDCLLTSRLCAGGMGEIYAAVHLRLGRDVAVKVPRSHATAAALYEERLVAEARFLARVSHPNVVQVFDLRSAQEGFPFMVLELLGGRSLDAVLRRLGALPVSLALELGRQVTEGVGAAHRAGVVGIDVKPENVMVVDGPIIGARRDARVWVKLVDFGTARLSRGNGASAEAPLGLGTPAYLAPELVRGNHASTATDIYALGLLLQETITGENPFLRGTAEQVMERHLLEVPPLLSERRPEVPRGSALEQLVADALSKDPVRRPPSAEAFLERLEVATEQWTLRNAPRWRPARLSSSGSSRKPATPTPLERETLRLPMRAALTPPQLRALDRAE